jgi:hypothetical protein
MKRRNRYFSVIILTGLLGLFSILQIREKTVSARLLQLDKRAQADREIATHLTEADSSLRSFLQILPASYRIQMRLEGSLVVAPKDKIDDFWGYQIFFKADSIVSILPHKP